MRKLRIKNELYAEAAAFGCGIGHKLDVADAKLIVLDRETRLAVIILVELLGPPVRRYKRRLLATLYTVVLAFGVTDFIVGVNHSPDQGYLWRGFIGLIIAFIAGLCLVDAIFASDFDSTDD